MICFWLKMRQINFLFMIRLKTNFIISLIIYSSKKIIKIQKKASVAFLKCTSEKMFHLKHPNVADFLTKWIHFRPIKNHFTLFIYNKINRSSLFGICDQSINWCIGFSLSFVYQLVTFICLQYAVMFDAFESMFSKHAINSHCARCI